ncbi:MAG: hypothetical protein SGI96_21180 [Bacteroidota bacterium]|nr:hypothetical protein [Bacteroidota bacterium]
MDLQLDPIKGNAFNCASCSPGLQKLRNCTGDGPAGKNLINGNHYPRCPRAMAIDSPEFEHIVWLYGESRDHHTLPFGESPGNQTVFSQHSFAYLDYLVGKHRKKQEEEHGKKMDKLTKQSKNKSKGKT